MSGSSFAKMVDDAVREELLVMGFDFHAVVDDIDEPRQREGCVIRMRGEIEDIEIIQSGNDTSYAAVGAQVRRKLEIALRGMSPFRRPKP